MKHLLEQLEAKVRERNAEDFVQHLISHWDGYFGSWLTEKQMQADHDNECEECKDKLGDEFIED